MDLLSTERICWVTELEVNKTYQVTTTGTVLRSFPLPNANGDGLEWEGTGVWTNSGDNEVSHFQSDGTFDVERTVQLPIGVRLYDIAIAPGRVYISAGDRIYTQDW